MSYRKGTQASPLSVIHSLPALTALMVIGLGMFLYSIFPVVSAYGLVVRIINLHTQTEVSLIAS